MSEVKRFAYDYLGYMEREEGGGYVLAADYDAIAQKLAATRDARDAAQYLAEERGQQLAASEARVAELEALLDTPHTNDWLEGVRLEAGHQIKRWGVEHDAGKQPLDWFWLIGFLAQKAATAHISGDENKARHHTISTGAALLNWFRAITGDSNSMRPGIDARLSPYEGKENAHI